MISTNRTNIMVSNYLFLTNHNKKKTKVPHYQKKNALRANINLIMANLNWAQRAKMCYLTEMDRFANKFYCSHYFKRNLVHMIFSVWKFFCAIEGVTWVRLIIWLLRLITKHSGICMTLNPPTSTRGKETVRITYASKTVLLRYAYQMISCLNFWNF